MNRNKKKLATRLIEFETPLARHRYKRTGYIVSISVSFWSSRAFFGRFVVNGFIFKVGGCIFSL
jgi:hypothetical protein